MSSATESIDSAMMSAYQQISSGKRINSAADDAAGLAISEKMQTQTRGLEQGTENAQDMQNLLRTAEGGLENISSALNRMREIGVQASNGIYTDSDRAAMQLEVDQLKSFIQDSAKGTEFNTMKLLDGSYYDKQAAVSPNGNSIKIYLEDSSLETLGIADFDVTKDFSLDSIDTALGNVNDARARIGATQNRLDYTINSNETSYLNQMQAMSRIADADIGKAMMDKSRSDVLMQYQVFSQREQMQRTGSMLSLLK
jgi:flagellin